MRICCVERIISDLSWFDQPANKWQGLNYTGLKAWLQGEEQRDRVGDWD